MKKFLAILALLPVAVFAAPKPGPTNTGPHTTDGGDDYENTLASCHVANGGSGCPATLTTYSGPTTITTPGTIIENFTTGATIKIAANNVTVRNCRIQGSYDLGDANNGSLWNIQMTANVTGVLIEDCEMSHAYGAAFRGNGSQVTIRRTEVWGMGADGYKAYGNETFEYNWSYNLGYVVGSHSDIIQSTSGSNITIRGNHFDCSFVPPEKCSTGPLIQAAFGNTDNVLIEENWVNGGNYSIFTRLHKPETNTHTLTNVTVHNNLFGPPRDNLGPNGQGSGANGSVRLGDLSTDANVVKTCNRREADLTEVIGGGTLVGCPPPPGDGGTYVEPPTANPGTTTSPSPVTGITLSSAAGVIHFTIDGSTPNTGSTVYTIPLDFTDTTVLKALTHDGGNDSIVVTYTYTIGDDIQSGPNWDYISITQPAAQQFEHCVDVVPSDTDVNSVWGLAGAIQNQYANLSAILRFNPTGQVDARNGAAYSADNVYNYVAGQKYNACMDIDMDTSTYGVRIKEDGQLPASEVVIASAHAFRVGAPVITEVTHANHYSAKTTTYSNITVDGSGGGPVGGTGTRSDANVTPAIVTALTSFSVPNGTAVQRCIGRDAIGGLSTDYGASWTLTGAPAGTTTPDAKGCWTTPIAAPAGDYTITYGICQASNPSSVLPVCADSTFTLTVDP